MCGKTSRGSAVRLEEMQFDIQSGEQPTDTFLLRIKEVHLKTCSLAMDGRNTARQVGRDRSVGIVTRYGLDCPGIESRWGQDFPHPSRPSLRPTQPPIQWVPGISRG